MLWIVENLISSLVGAPIRKWSYPPLCTSNNHVVSLAAITTRIIHSSGTAVHTLERSSPLNYTDVVSRDTST
jgi:hypothetical protein